MCRHCSMFVDVCWFLKKSACHRSIKMLSRIMQFSPNTKLIELLRTMGDEIGVLRRMFVCLQTVKIEYNGICLVATYIESFQMPADFVARFYPLISQWRLKCFRSRIRKHNRLRKTPRRKIFSISKSSIAVGIKTNLKKKFKCRSLEKVQQRRHLNNE